MKEFLKRLKSGQVISLVIIASFFFIIIAKVGLFELKKIIKLMHEFILGVFIFISCFNIYKNIKLNEKLFVDENVRWFKVITITLLINVAITGFLLIFGLLHFDSGYYMMFFNVLLLFANIVEKMYKKACELQKESDETL